MSGLRRPKRDAELAGRLCWCCGVICTPLRCTSQQMLIKPTVMGGRGPCRIPKLPRPMGECPREPLCSSLESPPPPSLTVHLLQLGEGFRHLCPAFTNPDSAPPPSASESLSLLALLQLPPCSTHRGFTGNTTDTAGSQSLWGSNHDDYFFICKRTRCTEK